MSDILDYNGEKFRIQRVVGDSFYASKMVSADKCQRGKPRRIFFKDLDAAGISSAGMRAKYKASVESKKVEKPAVKEVLDEELSSPAPVVKSKEVLASGPAEEGAKKEALDTASSAKNDPMESIMSSLSGTSEPW